MSNSGKGLNPNEFIKMSLKKNQTNDAVENVNQEDKSKNDPEETELNKNTKHEPETEIPKINKTRSKGGGDVSETRLITVGFVERYIKKGASSKEAFSTQISTRARAALREVETNFPVTLADLITNIIENWWENNKEEVQKERDKKNKLLY